MTTAHGPGRCDCGHDLRGIDRLLDADQLAKHLGVPRASLRVFAKRAREDSGSARSWWREHSKEIGGAFLWTWEDAEAMRIDRGQKH